MDVTEQDVALEGSEDLMSTSATSANDDDINGFGKKTTMNPLDPTSYVAKARVTRPTPPPPSKNPMQFVQIKPCNLYQTAQQQLKKAEEVKKLKEVKKEEPEDWQNNLDNWKSSRRKRVEHIIDRVVETKKLELEEHDRMRRKSKTFTEMMEERAERGGPRGRPKLASLAVYNEDETNDLSDLGIGTSSASGKSSLSEDYDNNSVMSDHAGQLDKAIGAAGASAAPRNTDELQNHINGRDNNLANDVAPGQASTFKAADREYISSPGYDTSSSTAPASSPDPCEYTYEGAIQDYKQRVQRATSNGNGNGNTNSKANGEPIAYPTRRGSKIEDRLSGFEVTSPSDTQEGVEKQKVEVPKVDISKRKEIFEHAKIGASNGAAGAAPKVVLRDRLSNGNGTSSAAGSSASKPEVKRLSGDITSIRDRMQSLEQQRNAFSSSKSVDVPVPPLKHRLNSLQQSVTKEDYKKPMVALIDARQLEIMRGEEERMRQQQQKQKLQATAVAPPALIVEEPPVAVTNDDSGIQEDTSDELQQQQHQLNAAIAALALEERQLEEAANAVNQIEAEFDELTDLNPSPLPPSPARPLLQAAVAAPAVEAAAAATLTSAAAPAPAPNQAAAPHLRDMEFSINEALELALEAIDRESTTKQMEQGLKQEERLGQPKEETVQGQNDKEDEEDEEQRQQGHREDKVTRNEEEPPTEGGEMPNKTDEQKRLEEEEQMGEREPIYENVSSTISMQEVDNEEIATMTVTTQTQSPRRSHRRSIPNKQTSSNNNSNQTPNQSDISMSNNHKSSNIGNHNENSNTEAVAFAADAAAALAAPLPPATSGESEPYYQVPKATEPYYDAPKHLRPIPVYENIEIFYTGLEISHGPGLAPPSALMEPPKEKPPPPPTESPPPVPRDEVLGHDEVLDRLGRHLGHNTDTWSSDNTYETISNGTRRQLQSQLEPAQPSPPIKRMNSTKRIKKELRNKRSSFLGIETDGALDDMESYLELTVAPPPDMAQLLQEERRLEKQLYIKAGLCDSSDTGDSRDSGVSENHSRQSSEHYTNSSEENDTQSEATPPPLPPPPATSQLGEVIYQNETLLAAQTPLLQTVKGNSAESWTESATAAAAATQSLSEATATANAKMQSIEEKIREQGEVLRVERELLHFSQEELKRQRENLLLRENLARRELQHGAKMLMSNNRRSLQDLHHGLGIGNGMLSAFQPRQLHQAPLHPPHPQQIYANVPQQQQQPSQAALYAYHQMETDYRKSMSDLNEFSNRLMLPPTPPTKPLRAPHLNANGHGHGMEPDYAVSSRQRQPATPYGGSLVKIAGAPMAPHQGYPVPAQTAAAYHHQSAQNLSNMSRNALLALSATPKPKYTDGWVQVQQRKSYDSNSNLANDPAWLSAQQQKRKSMPDYGGALYNNNHWLLQEAEQRRIEQLNRRSMPANSKSNGKPLPDSIIQTLTERVQSKGIGERKRFDGNGNYSQINSNGNIYQQPHQLQQQQQQQQQKSNTNNNGSSSQEKVLSVSGKKKCSHCGDELGKLCYYVGCRGAAMIIESLLLFYHINCFKCCVCHVQLGDGLNGTDVRVRNHKLHCQNCYSSDDGIKFSCV
ncbi:hypothetical protein KR018_003375 [Drosophila ironensis]|nr:hypothetical protein KR018_003375 [Drosophila ironensis]